MTLSEALDRARRERLGEATRPPRVGDALGVVVVAAVEQGSHCEKCNCIGFPELVDLVRGTVDMVCPACQHEWVAARSAIPTA